MKTTLSHIETRTLSCSGRSRGPGTERTGGAVVGLRLPAAWPVSRGAGTVAAVANNANGITQTFRPGTAVLRDQMAAFMYRCATSREGRRITLDPRGSRTLCPHSQASVWSASNK